MPRKILVNDPVIKALKPAAVAARDEFVKQFDSFELILNHEQVADAIRSELGSANSAEEIAELTKRLSEFEGDTARMARARARELLRKAAAPLRDALAPMVEAGLNAIAKAVAEAQEAERVFFARYGLPREETGVSRRFKEATATLIQFKAMLADANPVGRSSYSPPRNVYAEILVHFDV